MCLEMKHPSCQKLSKIEAKHIIESGKDFVCIECCRNNQNIPDNCVTSAQLKSEIRISKCSVNVVMVGHISNILHLNVVGATGQYIISATVTWDV